MREVGVAGANLTDFLMSYKKEDFDFSLWGFLLAAEFLMRKESDILDGKRTIRSKFLIGLSNSK